jgi:hypothetical protein
MLREWLAPETVESFEARCFGREPYARPETASRAADLLSWEELGEVLAAQGADVLSVDRGQVSPGPPPRSLLEARELLDRRISFVVRRAERCSERLRRLAGEFAGELGGEVKIQIFATPAGCHAFGWHWDAEHVFIVQAAGIKEYFLRANTTPVSIGVPDFGAIANEKSPLSKVRLHRGDWVYIPARWWHVGVAREEAVSMSIGVAPLALRGRPIGGSNEGMEGAPRE